MEYILKKGEVMSLAATVFPVIRVKVGTLWLTRTDDPRDYVLQRGDSFTNSGAGLVALESLSDCVFNIQCRETAPSQLTIRLTLAGSQALTH